METKKMKNDASASWHGFEYQGKITLYQVLKRINCLLKEEKTEEISRYSFLVEGKEDFDIYKDDNLIELNQVKAQYTKKNVSGYMEAIIKLYLRESDKSKVSLKFHTVVEIKDWHDKFENSFNTELVNIEEKIEKQKEKIDQKKNEINEKKIEIEGSETKDKTRASLENEYTKLEQQYNRLSVDCEKMKENRQKLVDAGADGIKSTVNLVAYEINGLPNNYCSSEMIEELIKLEIKTFFSLTDQKNKENDTEKYLIYLFFEISKHVRERAEKGLTDKKIPFNYICESLNDSKVLTNNDLYYFGLILNRFVDRSFSSYCQSYCSLREVCDQKSCFLKNTLFMKLNTMSIEEGYKLLKRMYPHKIIDDISLSQDVFHDGSIWFIFDEFSEEYFHDFISYHLQNNYYFIKRNKTYLPTGISNVTERRISESIEDFKKNIRQNIENKAFDIEKLYELDYLITENLETEEGFISDRLDVERDLMNKDDYDREQKRNRYIINLRKINDVREDLKNG